jgi:pullulanase
MSIYELHVRDFSANDFSVPAANRGKYLRLHLGGSNGMRHLQALSAGRPDRRAPAAGVRHRHGARGRLRDAVAVPAARPTAETQQAAVEAVKDADCFNWGYDPFHFNAPEGSYASDRATARAHRRVPPDGAGAAPAPACAWAWTWSTTTPRPRAERQVGARPHRAGLLPPADGNGEVERSTCCDNTPPRT